MKDQLRHDESISGNIDHLREDSYFDMDSIYGFIDAGSTWTGVTERIRKCSRILNLSTSKGLFSIMRMMIEGNSEI